jgi:Ca2+/Na+ antiporter
LRWEMSVHRSLPSPSPPLIRTQGSPDVFASITSFTGGQDVLIGIGALLGASMFVITVVVGVVTILSPCKVDASVFLRDTLFHLTSVTLFVYCALVKQITLYSASLFFILYAIYVSVVIVSWWRGKDAIDPEHLSSLGAAGVQAAYWHASTKQKQASITAPRSSDSRGSPDKTSEFNYTFLILGEPKFSSRDGVAEYAEEDEDEESGDGEVTINLSGGLITPHFDHDLLEDYFNPSQGRATIESEAPLPSSTPSKLMAFDGVEASPERTPNRSSFPSFFSSPSPSQPRDELSSPLISNGSRSQSKRRTKSSMVLSQWYWHQVQLRRRMHSHILNAEWWEYPIYYKLFAIFEFPLVLLRDLTIPTVDPELWSKPYAVLQPLFSPLLIIFSMGNWHSSVGPLSTPLLGVLIGVPVAGFVFLTTHHSKPPSGGLYSVVWVLMAFTMCVVWIYIFAGELVSLLQTIGIISGIPPAVLGLTILAWGNSVGDLFANMAVAKQGLGEMAIAGCYGGPVFNLCLGYGISFTYVSLSSFPDSFDLSLDASSVISLVFLYIALLSSVAFTVWNKFEMTSALGYFLLGLYCLYSLAQLCQVLFLS